MRLPKTYFLKSSKAKLLVDNTFYRVLSQAEEYRSRFELEFPLRRFNALNYFLLNKIQITSKKLEEKLSLDLDKEKLKLKLDAILKRLEDQQERQILQDIYEGFSLKQIRNKYDLNFDELLFNLRKIEAIANKPLPPFSRQPFLGLDDTKYQTLSQNERRVLAMSAMGFEKSKDIAIRTGQTGKQVDGFLLTARNKLGLSALDKKQLARAIETVNLDNRLDFYYKRLFDFLDKKYLQEMILQSNNNDFHLAGRFVNSFRDYLSIQQRQVLRRKLWGFSTKEIQEDLLVKKDIRVNDDSIYRDLKKAKEILESEIIKYFQMNLLAPDGIDPKVYRDLPLKQREILDLYLEGKSPEEIRSLRNLNSVTTVHKSLQRTRGALSFSSSDLDKLQKKSTEQNKMFAVLKLLSPEADYESYSSQAKIANDMNLVKASLKAMKELRKQGLAYADPKYFEDFYFNELKPMEIARKYGVDIKVVSKAKKSTLERLKKAFNDRIASNRPAGICAGRWHLLSKMQKLIYLKYSRGDSATRIICDLDLSIGKSSLRNRLKTIKKTLMK